MPRRTPAVFASLSFYSGFLINELPFLGLVWIVAATLLALYEGDIRSSAGWATFGLATLTMIGLSVIAWREALAIFVLRKALDDGLGAAWHDTIGGKLAAKFRPSFRLAALLGPFFRRRWDVELMSNISYGGAGKRNLLDVFRHRSRPCDAPVLIHFHGGAMSKGKKNREALPLLYRLASQGWVCVSANYRLQPAARYPDQLIDAKKVIAWVRAHGEEYGVDTSAVFVAGGSAGAQLAAHSALTPNDPELQPGFEGADTSVTAAITLYGYYRWIQHGFLKQLRAVASGSNHEPCLQTCSTGRIQAEIPPFFVVHGEKDTVIPVEDARYFVDILRSVSRSPIVYAELPGAQHTFDLFHSVRNEVVLDGIQSFAAWVRTR